MGALNQLHYHVFVHEPEGTQRVGALCINELDAEYERRVEIECHAGRRVWVRRCWEACSYLVRKE